MPYYLGIDGGGTKTTCAVGDAASLLATATSGPSNIVRVGEARARESLHQAVRQACSAAGIAPQQIARVCIGAAGAGRAEVSGLIRNILAEILPGTIPGQIGSRYISVIGDEQIALAAAFGAGPGVIVIAGTGSIAYGRDSQGNAARAGGWGFAVSDEGSAHWIGRAAVTAALRAQDEMQYVIEGTTGDSGQNTKQDVKNDTELAQSSDAAPVPPLLRELMNVSKSHSLEDFVRVVNSSPDFAALFPAVAAAADSGDVLAQGVLAQAAVELARIADTVIRRLFPEERSPSVQLAVIGGVFRHAPRVRDLFYSEVRRAHPRAVLHPEVVEPVRGALRLARQTSRERA